MKTRKITNVLEIVIRFEIEVPFLVTEETAREAGATASKLVLVQVGEALGELKKRYDVEVSIPDGS